MLRSILLLLTALASSSAKAETLEMFLTRPGSHALLTLELPFHVIHGLIEGEIDADYSGQKNDPVERLRDDVMTWEAVRGPLILGEDAGALVLQTSAKGVVSLKGKFGVIPVSLTSDLALVAQLAMRPVLLSDWSIAANLDGKAILSEAELYGLSIRGELQPGLDRSVNRALKRLSDRMSDPNYLRSRVSRPWFNSCKNQAQSGDLRFVPGQVAATQPIIAQNVVRMTVVFSGQMSLSDGQPFDCPELPPQLVLLD